MFPFIDLKRVMYRENEHVSDEIRDFVVGGGSTKKEKTHNKSETYRVADILQKFGIQTVLDIRKGSIPDEELEKLEVACQKENFFDVQVVREKRRLALADWSIDLKRTLLGFEARNLVFEHLIFDQNDLEQMADEDIEKLFDAYRKKHVDYFNWQENSEFLRSAQKKHEHLSEYYDVDPSVCYGEESVCMCEKQRRNYGFVPISHEMAAVYHPNGTVDKVFKLDHETEDEVDALQENSGDISLYHANWFKSLLSNFLETRNIDSLVSYIQVRESLPHDMVVELEGQFNIYIPDNLKKIFDDRAHFLKEVESYKAIFLESFDGGEEAFVQQLIESLDLLIDKKQGYDRDKKGGIQMRRDSLSVLSQCVDQTNKRCDEHFTICRYLYDRDRLPKDLVDEFEQVFDIHIPVGLDHFDSYDDYLKVPSLKLREFLDTYDDRMYEMVDWLSDALEGVAKQIRDSAIKTEEMSVEELVRQYVLRDDMDEQDVRDLTQNYQEMLSLPMRRQFEDKFGFDLQVLSVREQLWFLNYIRNKKEEDVDRTVALSQTYGHDVIKAFLSLEHDREMGDAILTIGEHLDRETAEQIYRVYGELVDVSEQTEALLKEFFVDTPPAGLDSNKVTYEILKRGKDVLADFARDVQEKKVDDIIGLMDKTGG